MDKKNLKNESPTQLNKLTRQQLRELEAKKKTPMQVWLHRFLTILPAICGILAILEYKFVPDNSPNANPNTYLWVLVGFISLYLLYMVFAIIKKAHLGGKLQCPDRCLKARYPCQEPGSGPCFPAWPLYQADQSADGTAAPH